MPDEQLRPSPAPEPIETPTTPLQVAPEDGPAPSSAPGPAHSPVQTSVFSGAGDQCPSCGAHMAADQRYCLHCGTRRGEPRLPFMDAVTFMDASRQQQSPAAPPPPPPSERKARGLSANASLIAGVGTLVLAIGVGVLIGRSGEGNSSAANTTPPIIKVEGGGGGSTATSESATASSTGAESGKGSTTTGGSSKQGKSTKKTAKAKSATGSSGTTKAAETVLKPSAGFKSAPPKVTKGGSCEPGQAGCGSNGKFSGSFFE